MEEIKHAPYPGLRPFNEYEALFFKGREKHIQKINAELIRKRFLMVTGASGDGKSSLIYAGLLPNVLAGFIKGDLGRWSVGVFRPGHHPLKNMAEAVHTAIKEIEVAEIEKQLNYGYSALVNLYKSSGLYLDINKEEFKALDEKEQKKSLRKSSNVLIVVDQFEEFFTNDSNFNKESAQPSIESQLAMNLLIETAKISKETGVPIYIVCTMRSDYIGNAPAYRGLPELIGDNQFFVPRLNREEISKVVEEPAELAGSSVSKRLSQRLINDLDVVNTDVLPSLQHALRRIWEYAKNGSEQLDLLHYTMAGGMRPTELPDEEKKLFDAWLNSQPPYYRDLFKNQSGTGISNVLNHHAELLFETAHLQQGVNLSKEESQLIIKKTFQCLTQIDDSKAVRNRVTFGEAIEIINERGASSEEIEKLLYVYRKQGNNFIYPFVTDQDKGLDENVLLDITHEALIRNWKNLLKWTREEYELSKDFSELNTSLQRWLESDKLKTELLSEGNYNYFQKRYPGKMPSAMWMKRYLRSKLYVTDGRSLISINEEKALTNEEEREIAFTRRKQLIEFLIGSKNEIARKVKVRKTVQITIVSLLVIATLGFFWAFRSQQNIKRIDKANSIATKAYTLLEGDPTLAYRLAEQAYKIEPTALASQAIMAAYAQMPFYTKFVGHKAELNGLKKSVDGKLVYSWDGDNNVIIWTIKGEQVKKIECNENLNIRSDHENVINLSPDNNYLIECGRDSLARIWDLRTDKFIFLKHSGAVNSGCFSPNKNLEGNYNIITQADNERRIKIWDTKGEIVKELVHDTLATSALFSPKGEIYTLAGRYLYKWNANGVLIYKSEMLESQAYRIAVSGNGLNVCLYDFDSNLYTINNNGKVIFKKKIQKFINHFAFSPNDSLFATAEVNGNVTVYGINGKEISKFRKHELLIWTISFSSDGKKILTTSDDGTAKIFDISGTELMTLRGHASQVISGVFIDNNSSVITVSVDKTIRKWFILPKEATVLAGHDASVQAANLSTDNTTITTSGLDYTSRVWGISGNEISRNFHPFYGVFNAAEYAEKKYFTTNYYSGEVNLLSYEGKVIKKFPHKEIVQQYGSFSFEKGKEFFVLMEPYNSYIWSSEGKCQQKLEGITGGAFSGSRKSLYTISKDSTFTVYTYSSNKDTIPFKKIKDIKLPGNYFIQFSLSNDEKHLITLSLDSTLRIWDTETIIKHGIEPLKEIKLVHALEKVRFCPDNNSFAVLSSDNVITLFSLSGNQLSKFVGHTDGIQDFNFSYDSKYLVSGSADKTIKLWDMNGKIIRNYTMHKAMVNKVNFSKDGKYILSCSDDKTARLMPTSIETVFDKINKEKVRGEVYELTNEELKLYGVED